MCGEQKLRIEKLDSKLYQNLFGVKKEVFDLMYSVLESVYAELHKFGGRIPKLSVLDKLIITLDYYKIICLTIELRLNMVLLKVLFLMQ